MAGGGALNLSLLSRGVGEVHKNGHEKVEVLLEPSDYYNFGGEKHYYHPALQDSYTFLSHGQRFSTQSVRDSVEFPLPKTFTTRKGALLLFSEDLALKTKEQDHQYRKQHYSPDFFSDDKPDVALKTVDDLAKSILRYGSRSYDSDRNNMYLKFIHKRREQWERQIRPGYSAKRYLSVWTRYWNNEVFETVVSKGYLTERSLFHYNMLLPHLRRHLFNEDLSGMPQPYRLMKNMLLSPGSLSGYSFYRTPPGTEFGPLDEEEVNAVGRPETKQSIHVIRTTRDGTQREVSYALLDRETQKEVITDLLVKSAVHYALFKQEEYLEESFQQRDKIDELSTSTLYTLPGHQKENVTDQPVASHTFDMREAVDSLLDAHRGPFTLGDALPDIDSHSHSSDYTGSFKGGAVPQHAAKGMGGHASRSSWTSSADEVAKEYIGGVPVVGIRDAASSASSIRTSVPHLPPIRAPLSPIRDLSREVTQVPSLPAIQQGSLTARDKENLPALSVVPPTPQQQTFPTLKQLPLKRDAGWTTVDEDENESNNHASKRLSQGPAAAEVSSYHLGSDAGQSPAKVGHGRRGKTKTQGSKHPPRSLAAGSIAGGDSVKGSTIMAPDGEIISVGGSVGLPRHHDVAVISDVTQPRREVNYVDDAVVSDEEPEEWPAVAKKKKKSLVSRKSDSITHAASKRDGDSDSLASASLHIDYTSGDIDATASIHTWTYAPARGAESDQLEAKDQSGGSLADMSVEGASQPPSSVTEQDIIDTLTDHARRVASSVLSQPRSGLDLEADVRGAVDEIMEAHRTNSANVFAAEYKELIRQSLTTAVAKATGLDLQELPADAEVSPELLEALTNQKLTPDDITIVQDETSGLPVLRSRQEITRMLGVAEGHIYVTPGGKGASHPPSETGVKPQVSIPADRLSVADMEYDVIGYGTTGSKDGSKPGSVHGGTPADSDERSEQAAKMLAAGGQSPEEEEDDFQKALKNLEVKGSPKEETIPGGEKPLQPIGSVTNQIQEHAAELQRDISKKNDQDSGIKRRKTGGSRTGATEKTVLSEKTAVSQKTTGSDKTRGSARTDHSGDLKKKDRKPKGAEEKDEPFVVGLVDHKEELTKLYGGDKSKVEAAKSVTSAAKTKEKKPKKDGEKKKVKPKKKLKQAKEEGKADVPEAELPGAEPAAVTETTGTTPPPPRPATAKVQTEEEEDHPVPSSPEAKSDDDMEFTIVRDEFSPEPERTPKASLPPHLEETELVDDDGLDADDDDANMKSISNREARAAKRAAAAAKRKEEVERKRREREEQSKREREEQERQEQLKREMEEERRKREEERRLKKLQEKEEEEREEQEKAEAERRRKAAEERERRAKEEYHRKLEEIRRKQAEEEARRLELLAQQAKEEEERRRQEELMLSLMAEAERLEYERQKKEEEEAKRRKEEEDRRKREEEAQLALLEAKRLAEEMARRKAELEARLRFNRSLQLESCGLDHTQDINRAFVFSYFELLQWLGLEIPEFELTKMSQF